jgi:hypothetical protein
MKLDIKIPIGLLFTIFGVILSFYGLATGSDTAIYAKSLGYNINLYIGLFMLVFGLFMLVLARKTFKEIK